MSKNMNERATKRKSAPKNSILKFLTVSSVSSDSIVKGIIDDIIKTTENWKGNYPLLLKMIGICIFLCTVVLSTSEKIAYMYTFKIMFDTSIIQ
jgi:hypothetical protein